ncbi:uncharacterized protein LOC124342791 isoform X2 [Daphnia pulicaria]|uniref:uncharacterized protein LOC124342791 isoform X2 n=1 Tax=Daphnia pulicaria TaxID=35523 RepID=UPI001EEA2FF1|nr:uncharacterized protein LOC124342791 isoform X2 [Daphnia pulicaria]
MHISLTVSVSSVGFNYNMEYLHNLPLFCFVNRIWYLNKNSIPTLFLRQTVDLKKSGKLQSDIECQLKQYEYAVSEFQTSKTSLSVVEIEATKLILTNDECGIPQNLTSRQRELLFNDNTQTWSYECVRLPENELLISSPSSLIPFIEGDKEVSTPCVSLECTTAPSSDSIVAPFVYRCSSMTEIPLRISTRQKTRPQRYRGTDNDLNMRHARMMKARSSSTKLRKPLINAVRSVNVEPVVECENLESFHVDDVDGFLIFSFANSEDLVKFCADQL